MTLNKTNCHFYWNISIFAILLTINACKQQANSGITDEKKVSAKVLNIMGPWYGQGEKEQIFRDLVTQFEFEHQEYKVNLDFWERTHNTEIMDEKNSLSSYIVNMIKSNHTDWDIAYLDYALNGEISDKLGKNKYWANEYMVDVLQYQEIKNAHKDFIFKLPYVKETFGTMIPGPILQGRLAALWYNPVIAQKIGISIKTTGMDIDDFISYVKQASEYNNNHSDKFCILNKRENYCLFFNLVYSFYFSNTDIHASPFEKEMNAIKQTYKKLEEISKFELFQSKQNDPKTDPEELMMQGNILFSFGMSDIYNKWKLKNAQLADLMIPCEIPTFRGCSTIYYQGFFQPFCGILKNAANKEGAIAFLKFISSHEVAEKYEQISKSPSGLKTVISTSDLGKDRIEIYNNYIMEKYGENILDLWGTYPKLLLHNDNFFQKLNFDNVLAGAMNAEQAFKLTVKD